MTLCTLCQEELHLATIWYDEGEIQVEVARTLNISLSISSFTHGRGHQRATTQAED